MRTIIILFGLLLTQFGQAQTKNLEPFTGIRTSAGVKVELYKSDTHKAEYTIHKGNEEDLVIEVNNGILTVKIQSKNNWYKRKNTSATVKVFAKEIHSVDCSSGSSLKSEENWKTQEMKIEVSSGANCKIGIQSEYLRAEASSGSVLTLSGSTDELKSDASSGARIDALSMSAKSAHADVSSGAGITLYVTESITADASSGGTIKYKGNPEKKRINSGMSGNIKSI